MTGRESLLTIIMQKGNCSEKIYVSCLNCPLRDKNKEDGCSIKSTDQKEIYKIALETFIEGDFNTENIYRGGF